MTSPLWRCEGINAKPRVTKADLRLLKTLRIHCGMQLYTDCRSPSRGVFERLSQGCKAIMGFNLAKDVGLCSPASGLSGCILHVRY